MKDYYYILGLKKEANPTEVENAFQKLAEKFHPDNNLGDKFFEDKYVDIQEAYATLSNSESKTQYDKVFSSTISTSSEPGFNFQPIIEIFECDKLNVQNGETINISWRCINADKASLYPIGEIDPVGTASYKFENFKDEFIEFRLVAENSFINKTASEQIIITNKTISDLSNKILDKQEEKIKSNYNSLLRKYRVSTILGFLLGCILLLALRYNPLFMNRFFPPKDIYKSSDKRLIEINDSESNYKQLAPSILFKYHNTRGYIDHGCSSDNRSCYYKKPISDADLLVYGYRYMTINDYSGYYDCGESPYLKECNEIFIEGDYNDDMYTDYFIGLYSIPDNKYHYFFCISEEYNMRMIFYKETESIIGWLYEHNKGDKLPYDENLYITPKETISFRQLDINAVDIAYGESGFSEFAFWDEKSQSIKTIRNREGDIFWETH